MHFGQLTGRRGSREELSGSVKQANKQAMIPGDTDPAETDAEVPPVPDS
jgi:hypothetical protein